MPPAVDEDVGDGKDDDAESRVDYPLQIDVVKKNKLRNIKIAPSSIAIVEVGETEFEELVKMGSKTVSFDTVQSCYYGNQHKEEEEKWRYISFG